MARLTAEAWATVLAPFCVIVNDSGILQDGNGDSLWLMLNKPNF